MPYITSVQLEKLPPYIREAYKDAAEKAQQLYRRQYVPYPNSRQAPIDEDIFEAHRRGRAGVGEYKPYLNEAHGLARNASEAFPQRVGEYMNPYTEHVTDRIAEEGGRTFRERILPQLEAQFIRLGQHGSSRHQELSQRAARDLQSEILSKQMQSLERGYHQAGQTFNADMARRMIGAEQIGGLGQAQQAGNLADIATLEGQGKYLQMQDQAKKDLQFSNFLRQQGHEEKKLASYMAHMQGIPYESSQVKVHQLPGTPQMNMMGNLGNLAGQLWGARAMAGHARGGYIPY